ncbi:MAG: hypothetical protein V1900_03200 [Candidatus Aenigmatarchaeota archaeon]
MEKVLNINTFNEGTRFKGENRRFCSLKGQMFLVAAILVVIALVALKNLFGIYATTEEKRFGESSLLDKQMKNLKNEFRAVVGVAALQNDANVSGINHLYNFSNLIKSDAKLLYVFVFNNATSQRFAATIGNFLNDKINVTLNATDSGLGYNFVVDDEKNITKIFQSTINGTVNLTFIYEIRGENVTEAFRITTDKNLVFAFFDVQLEDSRALVRSKDIYNWSWV